MSQITGSKINRVEFYIGPRRSGKTRMAVNLCSHFPLTETTYFAPNIQMLDNTAPIISNSTMGGLPVMACPKHYSLHAHRPTDFMIFDEYLMLNLKTRKHIYGWIEQAARRPVHIFVTTSPTQLYKVAHIEAAHHIKKQGKSIKTINKPEVENLYYNFLTDPWTTIDRQRLRRPVDMSRVNKFSGERILLDEVGEYAIQ